MRISLGRLAIASVLVWALWLGGCAPPPDGTPSPSRIPSATSAPIAPTAAPRPTPNNQPLAPPKAGALATDFTLDNLQGKRVSLSDFRGKKVMLNFWATWCGPCRIEIPLMVELHKEWHAKGFEIVAVNLREDAGKATTCVDQFKMTFPVLLDKSGKVAEAYFVRAIPTSIFLDEQGVIQAVHVGMLTDAVLRQYIDKLMR